MHKSRGFTLLEVMIALGIVAVLGALIAGTFGPTWAAKQTVEAEADRYHSVRLAMERMSREISMAYLSDRFDHKHYRERPTEFVSQDSSEDDTLTFTTLAHERLYEGAKESDQAIVAYRVGRDPDDRNRSVLFRREKTVIDDRPDDGGTETILADGIEGLDFKFWDVKAKEWVDKWDTHDTDHKNHLPQRVKITLFMKGDDGKVKKFVTQSIIFLTTPLGT